MVDGHYMAYCIHSRDSYPCQKGPELIKYLCI